MKLKPIVILFCLAALAGLFACKKSVPASNNNYPIAKYLMADSSLKLFIEVLQRSNNIGLLTSLDSITILAPVNTAFIAAGLPDTIIAKQSASYLDQISRYHFISGTPNIGSGSYATSNSFLDSVVYGLSNTNGVFFNGNATIGNKIVIPGTLASVYKLNGPMYPPLDSLANLIASDSNLTYFAEAVLQTGTNLYAASGWNTILVPDNNAFINAGYPTLQSIDSSNLTTLAGILQYHIIPGQYFSNGFLGLNSVIAANAEAIAVNNSNGQLQFTGTNNTSAASASRVNQLLFSNIVVHKINRLLLP